MIEAALVLSIVAVVLGTLNMILFLQAHTLQSQVNITIRNALVRVTEALASIR